MRRLMIQDRFATAPSLPTVDVSQDWILEDGTEQDGFTVIAFRRNWVTCDQQDRDVKVSAYNIIVIVSCYCMCMQFVLYSTFQVG